MEWEYFNRYYLKTREDGCIVDAWSDGPQAGHSTEGYIQFGQGGYQLRLTINGVETEENPCLWTMEGVPLYKYVDGQITKRSEEEIQKEIDQIPPPPPSEIEQIRADVDFLAVMGGVEL